MTARDAIIHLMKQRGGDKTFCPSEAARLMAQTVEDWRERMPEVHAAVDDLRHEGVVTTTWQGMPRLPGEGAYRIGVVS